MGLATTASRGEGPAVSAINGKVDAVAGQFDGDNAQVGMASLTTPVGNRLGAQVDGAFGSVSADDYAGGGGHLFWRDPDVGLIGLIASHQGVEDISLVRYGLEGEWYVKDFMFRTRTGYQQGDVDHGGFLAVGAKYYPTDKLMVESEVEVAAGTWLGKAGIEFAPVIEALPGLAVYAEGALAESGYDRWIVGLRYYFGPGKKSLRDRHRQDDPDTLLPDGMNSLAATVAAAQDAEDKRGGGGGGYGYY